MATMILTRLLGAFRVAVEIVVEARRMRLEAARRYPGLAASE